jgi:RNA polymerase sigma-70 factor (ECF subfamily)
MTDFDSDPPETCRLLDAIRAGDEAAFDRLFAHYRQELRRFVASRLDDRLRARLDASDVVQETQFEAYRRMGEFLMRRPMPFFIWLRKTAFERLLKLRRCHTGAARRSVDRERGLPDRSSLLLAGPFLARGASPSQLLARRDLVRRVREVVDRLAETDREVLLMRNVDELSYRAIGCILDLDPAAVRQRYGRALLRLRQLVRAAGLMGDLP